MADVQAGAGAVVFQLLDPEDEDDLEEMARDLPPPPKTRQPAKPGMKEDVFTLREGDVVIQWPERLSPASFADFEAWATLMLRKIKREAVEAPEPSKPHDDE